MNDRKPVQFPCTALPEDPALARLLGVYPQRSAGLFMQRVKAPEGRLTLSQWRGLADLAGRYTPDVPLHVTTRQNIELHDVYPEDLPALQQGIDSLGLTGVAACGDSVRNITVCSGYSWCRNTWDVAPLVGAIRAIVESLPWHQDLPRKFKISISGCPEACGRPWINDLGLVAGADGSLRVILAGSLGVRPELGIVAYERLPLPDVLPLVVAVLRLFHAEGDRANRGRARLRHVRQRLGDHVFLARVQQLFEEERRQNHWPRLFLRRAAAAMPLHDRLFLPLGDIAPEVVRELVEAVGKAEGELRLGMCHDLLVFAPTAPRLSARLAALRTGSPAIACPGTTWCSRGLVDSRSTARRILAALPGDCPLSVGVTGCPNNCSLAATADIGVIGRISRVGHDRRESFRLLAGGGKGESPQLGVELHPTVPADAAHEAVAWLVEEYRQAQRESPISFSNFVIACADRLRSDLAERFPAIVNQTE